MNAAAPRDPRASNLDIRQIAQHARGVAVSPHYLASAAGASIMASGGNAVDAAIAVNAVLGVVLPDTCGPGGDLFALILRPGDPKPRVLNSSGPAGSGVTAQALRDIGHVRIPEVSHWAITVPGCVDGWQVLAEQEGALRLGDVLAPAIELAAEGFPVSAELSTTLHRLEATLAPQPSGPPLYPGGHPALPGQVIRRPDLARTLEEIAGGGRDAFYRGKPGSGITKATNGVVTREDLERPVAHWVEPLGLDVLGRMAWTTPPNTQGYITLATLRVFEHLGVDADVTNPMYHHALLEAYRSIAWERDQKLADPRHGAVGSELLDPTMLESRAAMIDVRSVAAWPPPPAPDGGTAYMCTRDADGLAVSFIQSNFNGIGTGISAGDTGVFLHNRGAGFNLVSGHPNELAPGKLPLHTLSPTLWMDDGAFSLTLGTRGGHYQPQILAQVAALLYGGGLSPIEASRAPRWVVEGWAPGESPTVLLEADLGKVAGRLRALGHRVTVTEGAQPSWGPVSMIAASDSEITAVADHRVTTAAVAAA